MCWRMRLDPLTKGGCDEVDYIVAFTPKGGCPLKRFGLVTGERKVLQLVAFTPKGGCPLKLHKPSYFSDVGEHFQVAFTPKGGCPLKLVGNFSALPKEKHRSIHPQGWVPIETCSLDPSEAALLASIAFTPKGGCPLKHRL